MVVQILWFHLRSNMNLGRDESTPRDQTHSKQQVSGELLSPLDLFIRDLDERKGNILKAPYCQEVIDIQTSVENLLKVLLKKIHKVRPFYKTTLINSGSFYEGTKVGEPNEFDYFVQLDNFSEQGDILFEELSGSVVIVVPSESGFKRLRDFCPYPNFDWKISVKTPFVKALNQLVAEGFEAYGIKVLSSASKTNGPAYSLKLEWRSGERYKGLQISVDLSLAVKIHARSSTLYQVDTETPAGKLITSLIDSSPYYFAVSSYNRGLPDAHSDLFNRFKALSTGSSVEKGHVSLRCSQSCLEQALFLHFGTEGGPTVCLRVLKVLRDMLFPKTEVEDFAHNNGDVVTSHWSFLVESVEAKSLEETADMVRNWIYLANFDVGSYIEQYSGSKWISSYALKTLVLLEWEQNPTDEEWVGDNLSQRLLNILKRLHLSLTRGELSSFFYRDYKIFPSSPVGVMWEKAFIRRITILQILLLSIRDRSKDKYKFEECLENFLKDLKWTLKKVKLYLFLLNALQVLFDHQLNQAEEASTLNKERVADLEQTKKHLCSVYIQAFLEKIATEIKLIPPELEQVADTATQRNITEIFKEISSTRMRGVLNIPSFSLPLKKFERQDELAELLKFLFNIFASDMGVLLNKL